MITNLSSVEYRSRNSKLQNKVNLLKSRLSEEHNEESSNISDIKVLYCPTTEIGRALTLVHLEACKKHDVDAEDHLAASRVSIDVTFSVGTTGLLNAELTGSDCPFSTTSL